MRRGGEQSERSPLFRKNTESQTIANPDVAAGEKEIKMTKTDVIDYINAIKPNVYTEEQKELWIDLLENKLRTEVPENYEDAEEPETGTLIASGPYEDMYYRWVEAQIDYANNEIQRYNNALALFNDGYQKFRNCFNRTHKHKTASLSLL